MQHSSLSKSIISSMLCWGLPPGWDECWHVPWSFCDLPFGGKLCLSWGYWTNSIFQVCQSDPVFWAMGDGQESNQYRAPDCHLFCEHRLLEWCMVTLIQEFILYKEILYVALHLVEQGIQYCWICSLNWDVIYECDWPMQDGYVSDVTVISVECARFHIQHFLDNVSLGLFQMVQVDRWMPQWCSRHMPLSGRNMNHHCLPWINHFPRLH